TNQVTERCANAIFTSSAAGSPPLTYRWFFNGVLTNGSGSSLTLSNVGPAQAGSYFVTVSNSSGTVTSAVAQLTVVDTTPPVITQCPADRFVPANGSCEATMPDMIPELSASDCSGISSMTQSPLAGI